MKNDFDEEEKAKAVEMANKMGASVSDEDIQNVANRIGSMNKGALTKVWDKIVTLWDAFKSPDTPKCVKAVIIGGLIYMVSPVDLIPDVLPFAGLVDDASVIGMVFHQFVKLSNTTESENI